ncbi:GyrI-like domain-containing protein [candidate division WWE3 bacterium]|uniref:GyrI-like domain-containing protein n=1 Tax=candidate division WWE3 bacterium TaxID=2053526 RepID=A0A955LH66_UNCKA|nr:GyrI-like domain-containing protein [candidate division WWE3 bacterium]
MKYEWRKDEKDLYLPKNKPVFITVPEFGFITIKGAGNPNKPAFAGYIQALYPIAYGIKMGLKKGTDQPKGYADFTVYPLEGIWDVSEQAKKSPSAKLNKDELIFTLMIRQPDFVTKAYFEDIHQQVVEKKGAENPHIAEVRFENIVDGPSVQMLHLGPYDEEPASFAIMEKFAQEQGLQRISKIHREIYLSDFRKVPPERLKTVLRFAVKTK